MSELITLRIRQVKPAFWDDPEMAMLDMAIRALYIGLWSVADDAGYFPWQPAEIARHLRLDHQTGAEWVREAIEAINRLPGDRRVAVQKCRRHARVVHLSEHQRFAHSTKHVVRHETEHRRECLHEQAEQPPVDPAATPLSPLSNPSADPPRVGVGVGGGSSDSAGVGVGGGVGAAPAGAGEPARSSNHLPTNGAKRGSERMSPEGREAEIHRYRGLIAQEADASVKAALTVALKQTFDADP